MTTPGAFGGTSLSGVGVCDRELIAGSCASTSVVVIALGISTRSPADVTKASMFMNGEACDDHRRPGTYTHRSVPRQRDIVRVVGLSGNGKQNGTLSSNVRMHRIKSINTREK